MVVLLLRVLLRVLRLLLAGLLLLFRLSPSDSLLSFRRRAGGTDGDDDDGDGTGRTGRSGGNVSCGIKRPDEDRDGTEAARRRRPSAAASSSSAWC